jgi:hypothetical protein
VIQVRVMVGQMGGGEWLWMSSDGSVETWNIIWIWQVSHVDKLGNVVMTREVQEQGNLET